jgi:hypothetical protein
MTAPNLLALEPLLVARLRDQVPADAATIRTAADSDTILKSGARAPSVYVIYAGGGPTETLDARRKTRPVRVRQDWLIVATARNAAGISEGAEARNEAGALAGIALTALLDWTPEGALRPLELIALPDPGLVAGAQLCPFVVSTEILYGAKS